MGFVPNGPAPHAPVAPNTIGWATLSPTIVFTCAAFIVVLLRLYTRRELIRHIGREDFLICLSMVRPSCINLVVEDVPVHPDDVANDMSVQTLSFAYMGIVAARE